MGDFMLGLSVATFIVFVVMAVLSVLYADPWRPY